MIIELSLPSSYIGKYNLKQMKWKILFPLVEMFRRNEVIDSTTIIGCKGKMNYYAVLSMPHRKNLFLPQYLLDLFFR